MQSLSALLTRDSFREIPRRAAIVGDDIVELVSAPAHTPECHILSKICEIVRESVGLAVYSRDVEVLLHHCLYQNDEKAWDALAEDAACGLLTSDLLTTYFQDRPDDAACFVWRFQDARSMVHSACILSVFSHCLRSMVMEGVSEALSVVSHSLHSGQGIKFLTAYATHAKSLPSQTRRMALDSLGAFLRPDQVFDALAKDVMTSLGTSTCPEDILTILLASPCASSRFPLVAGPTTLSLLKSLLLKTPLPRRTPYVHALALLAPAGDTELQGLALNTLRACGESSHDVFLAAAHLIRAVEPSDQLGGLLARALLEKKT